MVAASMAEVSRNGGNPQGVVGEAGSLPVSRLLDIVVKIATVAPTEGQRRVLPPTVAKPRISNVGVERKRALRDGHGEEVASRVVFEGEWVGTQVLDGTGNSVALLLRLDDGLGPADRVFEVIGQKYIEAALHAIHLVRRETRYEPLQGIGMVPLDGASIQEQVQGIKRAENRDSHENERDRSLGENPAGAAFQAPAARVAVLGVLLHGRHAVGAADDLSHGSGRGVEAGSWYQESNRNGRFVAWAF